jgi:hypothetical protein
MSTAQKHTMKYDRATHTADMPLTQKDDIDLDSPIIHGEALPNMADNSAQMATLAFMEEPVTIRIEESGSSDFPETHVHVAVNGRGAEVHMNGQWVTMTWLPINQDLVTKRKYVEVLARSKSDNIKTRHEDANVDRPQNRVERRTKSNYPMAIIEDRNPRGAAWLSGILRGH